MTKTEEKTAPPARFTVLDTIQKKAKTGDEDVGWLIPEGASSTDPWKETDGLIKPLMPPEQLVEIYRKSSEVPKNARARGQNVAGFGWELTPVINFDDPELTTKAKMFIYLDRLAEWRRALMVAAMDLQKAGPKAVAERDALLKLQKEAPTVPTETEIESEVASWRRRADMEHALLTIRLRNFCYEYPLQELIKRTEVNRGALAYCGWEILRDASATPIRSKLVEALHMRPSEQDDAPVAVPWLRETSDVTYEIIQVERRFRRFLVKRNGITTWYKEFGDPRVVSQKSGEIYADTEAFEAAKAEKTEDEDAVEATEIMLWAEYSPGAEPVGMPIWHGHSLDVETSRTSKEFDFDELAHGKIPRMLFFAIDAMIDSPLGQTLKKFVKEGGIGNRNRVGFLEMSTAAMQQVAGAGRAIFDKIDFSAAQHDDATHLKLKEAADSGVSQDFGNPPILLGDSKSIQNRNVAEFSQQVAEEQTYTSLRDTWDNIINQSFVRPWGFRFWRFKLKAPRLQQVEAVGALIKILVDAHVITPAQAIPIAAKLLGTEFLGEPEEWQKVPPKMAQAGMTQALIRPDDDPMTVADESKPGAVDDGAPAETEITGEAGSEEARGLLEELGLLTSGFTDGPAQKQRERLGIMRKGDVQIAESDLSDAWEVDD